MDTETQKAKPVIIPNFKRLLPSSKKGLECGRKLTANAHGHLRRTDLNEVTQALTDFMDPDNPSPEQEEVKRLLIEKNERWWLSWSAFFYGVSGCPRERPLTLEEIDTIYRPHVTRTDVNKFKTYAQEFIYEHMPANIRPQY